jgi:hypothetical protein
MHTTFRNITFSSIAKRQTLPYNNHDDNRYHDLNIRSDQSNHGTSSPMTAQSHMDLWSYEN